MFSTLRDFLDELESWGELQQITEPVSPLCDIGRAAHEEARRAAARPSETASAFDPGHALLGGQALLFDQVEGCDFPLAINAFGSYRRMEIALGVADTGGFATIADRIAQLTKPQPPRSLGELVGAARQFAPLLRVPPRRVRHGRCHEVVKLTACGEVDLARLPLIKCWPLDGDPSAVGYPMTAEESGTAAGQGRYITFAGMHTIHADDAEAERPASHNIGMYRAQLVDATHLAMHWHICHDGAAHWRSWKARGERMPIAIVLGGEAVLPYAATAPLPPGVSELLMAGFLHGRGIPLVEAKTVPLRVPANAEIVIEGWVSTECGSIGWDPRETDEPLGPGAVFEGPFGDHTGFYSLPDRYPLVDVTAITHARDAIFPATIVGPPPQEDYYLGKATERVFLPLLQTLVPDIDDYHLPFFGCFHNCAFVRIRKQYPLQARRVMHAIWGAGQMAWTKMIVVVEEDVDVHDEEAVLATLLARCRPDRDVEIVNGPLDILDHAAPRLGAGHKIGFDATPAWPGEEVGGIAYDAPIDAIADPGAPPGVVVPTLRGDSNAGGRLAFLGVPEDNTAVSFRGVSAIESAWDAGLASPWVIAVESGVDRSDWSQVLFHLCANVDPGRDLVRRDGRLGFDATRKRRGASRHGQPVRDWPPAL